MRKIFLISWGLWTLSLGLPCLNFKGAVSWTGLECMLYGFFGIFYLHFETYANFLVLFASLMLISKHPKIGLLVSSIALWLASQTFFLPTSILISDNQSVQFQAFGPGFYCWFGSIVLIAIATLVSSVFSMTNENNA